MLDVRYFENPRFSAASLTITLTTFALSGSTFLLTQYFQFVLGYSPLKSGFMSTPVAIGIMVCAPRAPRLVERFGTKRVVVGGTLIIAVAVSCYGSDTLMSSVPAGWAIRLLFGAGFGFTAAPATESIMGSLPPGRAGVGSAVNDTTRQTGGALGVAVLGTLFLLRYRADIGHPSFVPPSALADVRDSIGTAIEAANRFAEPVRAQIVVHARRSYIKASRIVFAAAALFVLFASAVSYKFLPAAAPGTLPPIRSPLAEALDPPVSE
jgi:MFS family permease